MLTLTGLRSLVEGLVAVRFLVMGAVNVTSDTSRSHHHQGYFLENGQEQTIIQCVPLHV
jgi:hypothetical protein